LHKESDQSADGAEYDSRVAPKARDMKARGKREARRPWLPGEFETKA